MLKSHYPATPWLLALALLSIAFVSAWSDPGKDESGGKKRDKDREKGIVPTMSVCPQAFPLNSVCCVVLSVSNGNTEEPGELSPGDTFLFQFPDQGMTLSAPLQVQVHSPSMSAFNWQAGVEGGGLCFLRYVGPKTRFTARDLITCKLKLTTSGQPIQGPVQFQGPQGSQYEAPQKLCAPICVIESPTAQQAW